MSKAGGHRVFYELPDKVPSAQSGGDHHIPSKQLSDHEQLFNYVNENVIGNHKSFITPFGERKVIYCDYTASGRSLSFIEDYIRQEVLPDYGNTHTTTSITSLQTTLYRHEARDIIRNSVRASDHDAVLFIGNGCTGAIHKLVHSLHLTKSPVVIVGPYEHNSNLLPWRHLAHKIIRIPMQVDGSMSLTQLEDVLKEERLKCDVDQRSILCCFSAASNVSGILSDVDFISALVHRYSALVFWDYAAAAPYVSIDMNPVIVKSNDNQTSDGVYKDAIYFSFHKFVGGVQTPGCLIVKKSLLNSTVVMPLVPGGGTVFFVHRDHQLYLQDVETREEGGTQAIVESIRAGLVMQLKETIGSENIMRREQQYVELAWKKFSTNSNLFLLGGSSIDRLPIFSFLIRFPGPQGQQLYLHHNFVCTLLNDLFGIQARGGCVCAGPYSLDLLGLTDEIAHEFSDYLIGSGLEQFVLSKYFEYPHREVFRPGFTRVNLPYFLPLWEVNFILDAICFVAEHGWKLLPRYKYQPVTGEWLYHGFDHSASYKWLGHVSYATGSMKWHQLQTVNQTSGNLSWPQINKEINDNHVQFIQESIGIAHEIVSHSVSKPIFLPGSILDSDGSHLRWFALPNEAASLLWPNHASAQSLDEQQIAPFGPGTLAPCTVEGHDIVDSSVASQCVVVSVNRKNSDAVCAQDGPCEQQQENLSSEIVNSHHHHRRLDHPPPQEEQQQSKTASNKRQKRQSKMLWKMPPKEIFKPFLTAVSEFDMIQDGDRVMVCLSGGKDSLSLLHTIRQYQYHRAAMSHRHDLLKNKKWPPFDLAACTVDPGSNGYDPRPLIPYLKQLNVPYFYEQQDIMEAAKNLPNQCTSICSFCSRMKRGRLYAAARREGYNVLVMGHHLDDISESFIMSIFHNGLLRTMKANYIVADESLRIIRPFIYVREKFLRAFADKSKLPVIPENCPACFKHPKERYRIKQLLAEQEAQFPDLYLSLLSAMKPLLALQRYEKLQSGLERLGMKLDEGDDEDVEEYAKGNGGQCTLS